MKKLYYYLIGLLAIIISLLFDKQISLFFTNYRIDFLNVIAIFINNISGYVLFGIVFLILLITRKHKKLIPLIFTFISYLILTELIKIIVSRPRPFIELNNNLVSNTNPYKSFPSGHAVAVSSLIPFFDFNKILYTTWIYIAIFVSLSRVYLGVHYLSDVIAGFLLGSLISDVYSKISRSRAKKKKNR